MNKAIKRIDLSKDDPKHGVAKHYDDVVVYVLFGDNIGTWCYVSNLPSRAYDKEFDMTPSEVETLERLARKLVKDKKHTDYTLDLVNGTMTMS